MALVSTAEAAEDLPVADDVALSPDDALWAAVQGGERQAFATLFQRLQPGLLRYARGLVGPHAEDVAQEAWLALVQERTELTGGFDGARAFLFSAARRRAVDRLRAEARRPGSESLEETHDDRSDPRPLPEDLALDRLSATEAVDLLRRTCTAEQTEVVLLRFVAGFSADEVAHLLGRTSTWVRVTQHRALQRLGERVGGARDPATR
jgi:RNA polymerase sigma-70 factor (ECF subfamily)